MTGIIWAYTQIRNEWPFAGLSIVHHLENSADIVVVANHASSDSTLEGLGQIKQKYGSRIIVIELPLSKSHQATYANLILHNLPIRDGDWVFAFDADEFLIAPTGLHSLLDELNSGINLVKVEVINHLSYTNLEIDNFDQVGALGFRSTREPLRKKVPVTQMITEVESLHSSYFDYPFLNKVLVRWRSGLSWVQGAHGIKEMSTSEHVEFEYEQLFLAHFPMLSWEHLMRRVLHGKELIKDQVEATTGWQSQVVARLYERGNLPEFWEKTHCHPLISSTTAITTLTRM